MPRGEGDAVDIPPVPSHASSKSRQQVHVLLRCVGIAFTYALAGTIIREIGIATGTFGQYVATIILDVLTVLVLVLAKRDSLHPLTAIPRDRSLLLFVPALVLSWIAGTIASGWLILRASNRPTGIPAYATYADAFSGENPVIGCILMLVIAPMTEELLFRGTLYRDLRKTCPVAVSVVISSVLFALLHGNYTSLPLTLLLGTLTAMAYERTESLPACVMLHALSNLMTIAVTALGRIPTALFSPYAIAGSLILALASMVLAMRLTGTDTQDSLPH